MKILFSFALFFYGLLLQAQVSSGGVPTSFLLEKHNHAISNEYDVEEAKMPDYNMIQSEDDHAEKDGRPYRVAVNIDVDYSIHTHGTWTILEDGSKLWRLGIKVEGAQALGVYFSEKLKIPEGGRLFAYNARHSQFVGAYTHKTDDFTAMEMVQGEEVTLEYHMPSGAKALPNISIKKVGYFYRGVGDRMVAFIDGRPIDNDRADACQVDVACSEITGWEPQRDAVVKYTFVLGNGTFLCTGAIINNTAEDCTPYVLTANHCGEPTNSSDIQDHVWYFNYQRDICSVGNTIPYNGAQSQTMSGGFFRASSELGTHIAANNNQVSGSDFALLELSASIPDNYNPFYAGWSNTTSASSSGVGIHHPSGHEKKISTYNSSLSSSTFNGGWSSAHWQVFWSATANGHGVTEGGSSGSPIFNSSGEIVGHLSGGSSFCAAPNQSDLYGKFNRAWELDGNTASSKLKSWLDPSNTGVLNLSGSYDPCATSSSTYCAATSITCDEYIENVTIGGVSNTTSCDNYAIYWQTNPLELEIGASYYLQITTGIINDTNIWYIGDQIGAWIDWNADGDFADAGEYVYTHIVSASSTAPLQTIVTVPANAEASEIRMRVRISYDISSDGILEPCGTTNYGEVEDYVIRINPASLSVHESSETPVSIYPNPTNGSLTIDFDSDLTEFKSISVFDLSGKKVFDENLSNSIMTIDLNHLEKGIYFIEVKTNKAPVLRKIILE